MPIQVHDTDNKQTNNMTGEKRDAKGAQSQAKGIVVARFHFKQNGQKGSSDELRAEARIN